MSLNKIARSIPSWAVGVFGAFLVVVSTIASSIVGQGLDDKIRSNYKEIAKLEKAIESYWDSHKLADERAVAAALFASQFSQTNSNQQFILNESAYNLRGSILAMWAATDGDPPEQTPPKIVEWENRLRKGDITAYEEMKGFLNKKRLNSQKSINAKNEQIVEIKSEINRLQPSAIFWRWIQIFFNILGLVIVLLKDLPIWRDKVEK